MWHTVRYAAESRYVDQEIALKIVTIEFKGTAS